MGAVSDQLPLAPPTYPQPIVRCDVCGYVLCLGRTSRCTECGSTPEKRAEWRQEHGNRTQWLLLSLGWFAIVGISLPLAIGFLHVILSD